MSWETLHNTVRTRFKTQVADAESLPTQYDNAQFAVPQTGAWATWSVIQADSLQASTGGGNGGERYRTLGLGEAQIFTALEEGPQPALALADKVRAAFRRVTQSGVVFESPSLSVVGREGKWWQVNVTCPFYADDVA